MTIAAGFVADGGLLLCTDTLLSANYRKLGRKAWYRTEGDVTVAVTGAGDYVLLKLAAAEIMQRISANLSVDAVQHKVIERVLASIHDDHVDKAPLAVQASGYGLNLIVGVKVGTTLRLLESSRRAVSEVEHFSCVGSGAPVGNYIASILYASTVPLTWARVVAAYVIQQSIAYGEDCGGETNLILLPKHGTSAEVTRHKLRELERVSTMLHEAIGSVLLSCVEPGHVSPLETVPKLHAVFHSVQQSVLDDVMPTTHSAGPRVPPIQKSPRRGRKVRPA